MKSFFLFLAAIALPASALTIRQDQGQLSIEYAKLNVPYEIQVSVPKDCAPDMVSVAKSASQITVRHLKACHTGATVTVKVNSGQSLDADLGAGSLELLGFNSIRDSIGRISAESEIGSVSVPTLSGFAKTFDNYVGRSYQREGQVDGSVVELKVHAGLVKVGR